MIRNILDDLFVFQGRMRRTGFVVYTGAVLVFSLLTTLLVNTLVGQVVFSDGGATLGLATVFGASMLAVLLNWINAAITVKRLHDLEVSGWWYLAIVGVNTIAALSPKDPMATMMLLAVLGIYGVLAFLPGSRYVNFYGDAAK